MKPQKQIGKNIKETREKTDYTQEEIAKKVGVHVNYFARIERGEARPSLKVLEKIAKVLKMELSDIFRS
jgi:transcriptional regulator with XRE-family HTH domain